MQHIYAVLCSYRQTAGYESPLRYLVVVREAGNIQFSLEIFQDCFVKICLVFLSPYNFSYTLIQNINCFIPLEIQQCEVFTTFHRHVLLRHNDQLLDKHEHNSESILLMECANDFEHFTTTVWLCFSYQVSTTNSCPFFTINIPYATV